VNRRSVFVTAATVALLGAVAVVMTISTADIYTPPPVAYELSADRSQVTVAYCGGSGDTIASQTLREDERSVVVGVRFRRYQGFQNGAVQKVGYTLGSPLAGRVVRGENGALVPAGSQFLCAG
jgi:hypothetical protein